MGVVRIMNVLRMAECSPVHVQFGGWKPNRTLCWVCLNKLQAED